MDVVVGSVMEGNSQFSDLRRLSSLIVLIRSLWFHSNTRSIRSQITFSTGAIIGRRCVLTAAHNIYQPALQAFCDEVELVFNFNAGREITKDHIRISFPLEYSNFKCSLTRQQKDGRKVYEHDFALILIPTSNPKLQNLLTNNGDSLYLLANLQVEDKGGIKAYIQGFPDLTQEEAKEFKEKREEMGGKKGGFTQALIREDVVRVTRVDGNGLYYSCRTKSGQSGSPVMVAIPRDKGVDWYIIGIHNSFSKIKSIGKGVFLNSIITALLRQWYLELTSHKLFVQEYHELQAQDRSSFVSSLPEEPILKQQEQDESQQQMAKFTAELEGYLQQELQCLSVDLMMQYRITYREIGFEKFIDSVRDCFTDFKQGLMDNLEHKMQLESDYLIEPAGSYAVSNELHAARSNSEEGNVVVIDKVHIQEYYQQEDKISNEDPYLLQNELRRDHPSEIMASIYIDSGEETIVEPIIRPSVSDSINEEQLISASLTQEEGFSKNNMDIHLPVIPKINFKKIYQECLFPIMEDYQSICYQCLYLTDEWFVCLEEDCAQRSVELCSYCISEHREHAVFPAKKEALTSFFHSFNDAFYRSEEVVGRIEGRVAVMTNLLSMNLLKKMMESLPSKLEGPLQLLNAMLFKKDSEISERVTAILDHNREEIYSASLSHKLMHSLNHQQLSRVLQTEIDRTRKLVTTNYENIQSSFENLRRNVIQSEAMDYEDTLILLQKKYESIINIKTEYQYVIQPENLYDIDQDYYEFIRDVVIMKDFEEYQEKEHFIKKRNGRQKFWQQNYIKMNKLKQKVLNKQLPIEHLKMLIQQYVLELQDINNFRGKSQEEQNIEDLLNIILMRSHSAFREKEQYDWQSTPLKIFNVLLHPKMTNLVRIEVRYDHARCCDFNSFFKLEAIDLFRIIDQNPNLQKLAIEGVRVYHFGRLIVKFYQIRCNITKEIEGFHYYLSDEDTRMMQRLNPKRILQLDLGILLKIRNRAVIVSLEYFLKVFPCVSNLKVAISYSESIDTAKEDGLLEVLKRSLEQISRLKIWIMGQYLPTNTLLLDAIKGLNNIVSVYISDFQLSVGQTEPTANEKRLLSTSSQSDKIKKYKDETPQQEAEMRELSERFVNTLAEIISHNQIEKFSIKRCPLVMGMHLRLPFLKELIMVFREPRAVNWRSLKNPEILELLYLQNVELQPEQEQQSLEAFFAKLEAIRHFQIIESNIEDRHLLRIPLNTFHRIKILNISLCDKISDSFARAVFPSLEQIAVLDISKTKIAAATVLMITSVLMQRLIISGLGTVYDHLLWQIDKKWPMLTSLNIYDCKGTFTENGINEGSFRNLSELQISHGVLEESTKFKLLMRGVEILPFY